MSKSLWSSMTIGDPPNEEARITERTLEEKPVPTIWHTPDELWEKIEPILQKHDPPRRTGRPRVYQRAVLYAVVIRLRTGCQ
jgi:putative transposase of IS4/5 family DUF4096